MKDTLVIVGAGIAGVCAAAALRSEGFDGRLVLIGSESHMPYDRPPLSKQLLLGSWSPHDIRLHPEKFYSDADIELCLDVTATRLLPNERRLVLEGGDTLRADQVLLCTGGVTRRLDVPGGKLANVHYLRSLDDSLAIRDRLVHGTRVVVIGAGWIGAEVAATAQELGCKVTVLEIAASPLSRILGVDIGHAFARIHREHGIDLRTGVSVVRINGRERVDVVETTDGRTILADVVVVGIGMVPDTRLAEQSGIPVNNGILVDEFGETSIRGVFAAGDVANRLDPHSGQHIRLEHWQSAQRQAKATARSMLGQRLALTEVPWFWSDQFGINLQLAGDPVGADGIVVRGDLEDVEFAVFYLQGRQLVAALGVNRPREVRAGVELIARKVDVERDALADPGIDLRGLAKRTLA